MSDTIRQFNRLVSKFDELTGRDTASPVEILSWYKRNDPLLAGQFETVARQLGYFDDTTE